ncbi:receptor-like protein kinase ANXUR2 [Rutidosis leptorrhynchoides]|uniref:receptor-like protein kinase ANXUR2 n=1 Tax=Rutidosis leptorrhynchoides TaxID=125765 RepID=UPI003A98E4BA
MLATDNFSATYHIGGTTYYELYKAELGLDKENVASLEEKNNSELSKTRTTAVIKRVFPREARRGDVFTTELEMLTICKHRNIVTLLGVCDEGSEMILVVEHASNGYLDEYLFNIKYRPILSWAKRLKICLDVGHALNYLHYEMENQKTIINCDIRSGTIALDENWGAKIVDFGFSIFLPPNLDALHLNCILGHECSIDPEYEDTGKLKRESDVYSFGVVLFEILCGRVANDDEFTRESDKGLAFVIRRCFHEGTLKEMIDPIIKNECTNKDSLDVFIKIAYQCLAKTQDQRPTMKVVIKELEKALTLQVSQDTFCLYSFST